MYRQVAIAENPLAFESRTRRAVRGISPEKAKRLRILWFILGMLAGVLATVAITSLFSGDTPHDIAALSEDTEEALALAEEQNALARAETEALEAANLPRQTHFVMQVGKGDTLMDMLTRRGASYQEAHALVEAMRKKYNPRRLTVGQEMELQLTEEDSDFTISHLAIRVTPIETLEVRQTAKNRFSVDSVKASLNTELVGGGGVIRSSLYQTGVDSGIPPAILGALINAYSYDVDFQRDIRSGDRFQVVYEAMKTDDDVLAGHGKLLYASLTLGGDEKRVYHFTRKDGEEGFYDPTGLSVRKALLRTPINGARLSSGFGMRRHPVLGYGKMHKGVDFAAPTGTPIYAAGDGVVEYASAKGSYGNYVRVRHTNQYSTAYAHLNSIAKSARKGARVKQGQVIGYVGTTGRSTGPHLHYEVLSHGKQVNPSGVKFPTGHKLSGTELANFNATAKQIDLIAGYLVSGEAQVAKAD